VNRKNELQMLKDRAGASGTGAAIGFLTYQTDFYSARGEVSLIEQVQQRKNCEGEPKSDGQPVARAAGVGNRLSATRSNARTSRPTHITRGELAA
jgi:hypothetical protein